MNLFAIIVTYNGRQVPYWYDNCFTSLRESTIPVQTIVIDNASTDDTVAYIREHFPEVMLIESDKNLGFGQANNMGMRYALDHNADYVFLLNQDAWVEPDTLEKMVQIAEKNPEYGILAPMNLNKEKDEVLGGFMRLFIDEKNIDAVTFANDMYFNRLNDVYPAKVINASAWLMPRKILETIGGFDPIFFHYGEDDNYLQRMEYHKQKVGLCPLVTIVHDEQIRTVDTKKHLQKDILEKRVILMKATDINDKQAPSRMFWDAIKRYIKSLLLFRKNPIKESWLIISYLLERRMAIQYSRMVNQRVGRTWL